MRIPAAEPDAVPFSSTETAVVTTTVPVQFAMIGKFVKAQYVRSGKTEKVIDPVAEPCPLTVQLEFEETVPFKCGFENRIFAPKLPVIVESCVTLLYETDPWIWRFDREALALPRLVAAPAAVAVDDELHPNLAAQLSPIPSPPPPIATSRTDRGHAGNAPRQHSLHPPKKLATCA